MAALTAGYVALAHAASCPSSSVGFTVTPSANHATAMPRGFEPDRHKFSHRDAHQSNECGFMSAKQWHLMPAKAIDAVFEQNHILADAWFCRKTEKLRLQINKIRVRHHVMAVLALMSP